ncbi:MAG TPA: hypothetical protein VK914_12975 [bacterium]|nr:hypothetical protein [bacterium]
MDKRQILKSIVAQCQAGQWNLALDECRKAAVLFPGDVNILYLLSGLAAHLSVAPEAQSQAEAAPVPPLPLTPAPVLGEAEARSRALMEEAVRRRVERQGAGGDSMAAVMQSSRRIADVLHAATTKHIEEDVDALLVAAQKCLSQGLLPEAMRLCQKIVAQDPENEPVKALLLEIYQRKGL